jgi:hypothetical protein
VNLFVYDRLYDDSVLCMTGCVTSRSVTIVCCVASCYVAVPCCATLRPCQQEQS